MWEIKVPWKPYAKHLRVNQPWADIMRRARSARLKFLVIGESAIKPPLCAAQKEGNTRGEGVGAWGPRGF